MVTLVTRSGKGSELTHAEVDANFNNLDTGITAAILSVPEVQDGNYTFALDDSNTTKYLSTSATGNVTYTIPLNSSVAFSNGTMIRILNLSTYDITITADSSAVLYWLDGLDSTIADSDRTLGQRGECTIQKLATDTWVISGNAGLY